jgi:MerR family transcriptional regulator, light-induced transcriptional regulator
VAGSGEALRIGELSRRVGVSPELLRAWERRYGLLRPARSAGGLRLYSPADVERVALMQQHLAEGLAAAEAAALALREAVAEEAARTELRPATIRDELSEALAAFDEPRAQAILDRLLALATLDTLLTEVIVPYLQELGERWERGEVSVAQEHFASSVVRGRLLGLARGWGLGLGPAAVLACLPGEQHDLGLIAFGLALRSRGWRIVYLGPDSPIDTVSDVSRRIDPTLVVLNAVSRERVRPVLGELRTLARRHRVALGGAAAGDHALEETGILALTSDPTAEAARVTTLVPSGHNAPRQRSMTPSFSYLSYPDAPDAIDWLDAIGFSLATRQPGDHDTVPHAELRLGDAVVMHRGASGAS